MMNYPLFLTISFSGNKHEILIKPELEKLLITFFIIVVFLTIYKILTLFK